MRREIQDIKIDINLAEDYLQKLKKRTEKKAELLLSIEPLGPFSPGDMVTVPIDVKNAGSVETVVALTCRHAGRLISEESAKLPPGSSYKWSVSVTADPKLNQIAVSAQYTLPNKEKRTEKRLITIPVKELGAKVEIDTSALDVFKDI